MTSCKQLNNWQLDDLLAICEAHGWRQPDKPDTFYRDKAAAGAGHASFAQQSAVGYLSGGLGWTSAHLGNFINSMTKRTGELDELTPREAFAIIEALKAIYNRENKTNCKTLTEFKEATSSLAGTGDVKDGSNQGE